MATSDEIASFEADIGGLIPLDDKFIFSDDYLLPQEEEEAEEWDLEGIYAAMDSLRKTTEPSDPSPLSHPALQSMDEPLDCKMQVKIKQNAPVPPNHARALGDIHEMIRDMAADANESYQQRLRQFDAMLKPTLAPDVHPGSFAAAIKAKYPDNNAVIQKAIYMRKKLEQDFEEAANGAMEEGQRFRPSEHKSPTLMPWMIKFLESHFQAWGPANDREIFLLTQMFGFSNETAVRDWTENKKNAMRIWKPEMVQNQKDREMIEDLKEKMRKDYQKH